VAKGKLCAAGEGGRYKPLELKVAVGAERPLDIGRDAAPVGGPVARLGQEGLEVLADDLPEGGGLGGTPGVRRGLHGGTRASRVPRGPDPQPPRGERVI